MSSIYKLKCDVCLKEWDNDGDVVSGVISLNSGYRYLDGEERHVCFDCVVDPNVLVILQSLKELAIKQAKEKIEKETVGSA